MTTPTVRPVTSVRRLGGSLDVVLAAALWGTTGTVRHFMPAGPAAVGAARLLVGGAFLVAVAVPHGGLRPLLARGARVRLLLLLGAAAAAAYQVAFFIAVARTGVATGTVVTIGSGPVFAGLLSWLARMGTPSRRWLICTAGAVGGCAALSMGGRSTGADLLGIALALLAGCGYAAYATVASFLITRGDDSRAVVGAMFAGAGVLSSPVLVSAGSAWLLTGRGALGILYLGVVTTGFGYLWYGRGLRTIPVAAATTLTLAEPAVAAVLGLAVLHEHVGPVAIGGLCLLTASLALLTWPARSR